MSDNIQEIINELKNESKENFVTIQFQTCERKIFAPDDITNVGKFKFRLQPQQKLSVLSLEKVLRKIGLNWQIDMGTHVEIYNDGYSHIWTEYEMLNSYGGRPVKLSPAKVINVTVSSNAVKYVEKIPDKVFDL